MQQTMVGFQFAIITRSMKIKDMIFAHTGELNIDDDTRLNNPRFELISCRCDLKTNQAFLMLSFYENEGTYRHGREYEFTASDNGVTASDLVGVISNHPVLSQFTLLNQ